MYNFSCDVIICPQSEHVYKGKKGEKKCVQCYTIAPCFKSDNGEHHPRVVRFTCVACSECDPPITECSKCYMNLDHSI